MMDQNRLLVVLHDAEVLSKANDCTQHVNATVRIVDGRVQVTGLYTSDWYSSDATIATFTNGERQK